MSITAPPSLVVPFANGGAANVIPVAAPPEPGAASFTLGFPPATMLPRTSGGIPPAGLDMNGVLKMISQHTAWLAAGGGFYPWNADVITEWTGYAAGAIVRSDTSPLVLFISLGNNNAVNPNDGPDASWLAFSLVSQGVAAQVDASSGTINNLAIGTATGLLVLSSSSAVTLTGADASYDGQQITILATDVAANVTIASLNGGSLAANQFQLPADVTLLQNMSLTLKYFADFGKWVQVS